MNIYVIQVRSGKEEAVCKRLQSAGISAFVPRKKIFLRRGGAWHEEIRLIFSQYVFVQMQRNTENYRLIRQTDGFIRFLGDNLPRPVSEKEKAWLLWLRNGDKPLGISRIMDTSGGAKFVLDGALRNCPESGYEVTYQLRQRRAVVCVPLMGRKYKITLPVMPV